MSLKRWILLLIACSTLIVERCLMMTDLISNSQLFSNLIEVQLLLVYFYVCYMSAKRLGPFNIFTLFLFTLGLFNYMKIFYGIFTNDNYRNVFSLIEINLSERIVQETIWVYTLFTVILYVSFMFFHSKHKLTFKGKDESNLTNTWQFSANNKMFKIGRLVMLITLPAVLYRCYIELSFLGGGSFTDLYAGGSQAIDIPSYIRTLSVFFQVGFMMILGSKPSKAVFVMYSSIYLVTIIPYLTIGLRSAFGMTLLFFIWYYIKIYQPKISVTRFIIPGLTLILVFQIIGMTREGGEISSSILMLVPLFLTYQSQSMYVLSLYIQYKDSIDPGPYPYILDPVIGWLTMADGQTLDVLQKRSSLGHQMIYFLNPEYYLSGASLGTNCIAELYQFGALGIILGAIGFAWFILKFDFGITKNRALLFFSLFISTFIFMAPRSTYFPSVYIALRYVLVYGLIMIVWKVINMKVEEKKIFSKSAI